MAEDEAMEEAALKTFRASLTEDEAVEWDCLESNGITPPRIRQMTEGVRTLRLIRMLREQAGRGI